MKKNLLILIALPLLMVSCENKEQLARISQLEQQQADLLAAGNSKDSLINDFLETMNQIEANLKEIKTKEKLISQETASGTELSKPVRERINEDIRLINELLSDNKKKIASLSAKLSNSKIKITELEAELKNMIELTNQQMAERNSEIQVLKNELAGLNFNIAALNDTISIIRDNNRQLATSVTEKTNELNTAYFIVNSRKALIEKKIINKEGGVLGIGRTQKIAGDVNLAEFTKIDIRSLKSIPLGVKKATLMSVHPEGSYELIGTEKKIEELLIKDPAAFWQKSKMLIISTEV